MSLVGAVYAPNAPMLIDPSVFGGVGEDAARSLRALELIGRLRPEAVVVSSPHWVGRVGLRVNVDPHPRQLYDFSGFPPALSRVLYAPPGDPALAERMVSAGRRDGVPVEGTTEWGLDHGAWAPLLHLVPGATVPVVPTSIVARDPALHLRWGASIRSALDETPARVVVVATGSILHNFGRMGPDPRARWPEGEAVERAIVERALALDAQALVDFDRRAWSLAQPEGDLAPLFVLLGAVGKQATARRVHSETVYGSFSLSTLEFLPSSGRSA